MNGYRLWLAAIILVALALRLYNLTYHSLWFDEAISIHWARQSIPRIVEVGFSLVEDRLPPLYYLMLKGWTTVFGFGESSVRGLSILFGVLLVPVVAGTASLLFRRRVALVTAALIALNPFLIWYSQEARMYAPAVFFGALAVWSFLQMVAAADPMEKPALTFRPRHKPRFRLRFFGFALLFILAAIAGLYSHLYAGFLLPALGVWLIMSYPRRWDLWLIFAICGLLIMAAFYPIAVAIWRFSGQATPGEPFSGLPQRAWWLIHAFFVWKAPLTAAAGSTVTIITLVFAALAYLKPGAGRSAVSTATDRQGDQKLEQRLPYPLLFVTLLLVFPFLIASLLLFRNHLAFFGARYFIVMVPWLLVLAAVGATNLETWSNEFLSRPKAGFGRSARDYRLQPELNSTRWRSYVSYLPYILLLVIQAIPVPGQWSTPAAKEAWRQTVAYLAQQAAPTDAILIHPAWVRFPFQYYFQGPGQTYAAFSDITAETLLDDRLQGVSGDHNVIWLIQSHVEEPDPTRRVEQWFASRYPLVTELHPPGISIKGFARQYQLDKLPPGVVPVDIRFENGLRLVGYETSPVTPARDELFHPPSAWLPVTLYWTSDQPIQASATPFVHLVGPEGIWGASLERSGDTLKLFPPTLWSGRYGSTPANPIVRHDLDINLNPTTPAGTYQLVVGLPGETVEYPLTQIRVR